MTFSHRGLISTCEAVKCAVMQDDNRGIFPISECLFLFYRTLREKINLTRTRMQQGIYFPLIQRQEIY